MLFDDTQEASNEKEDFIGSKIGVYKTGRYPEIREMWENDRKILLDKIYEINKPQTHKIEIVSIED
jgi:hypothetical protein